MGAKDLVLFGRGEAGEEGEDLDVRWPRRREGIRRVADIPLAWQKHQDVARSVGHELTHCIADRLVEVTVTIVVLYRAIAHLDGVGAARNGNHGSVKVRREAFSVDRRRGDDHLQVWALGEQLRQVAEEKVDVEGTFVCFFDDDRVVRAEQSVVADLGEQDAVGHHLHERGVLHRAVEADRIADGGAEWHRELLGDPFCDRHRGNAPGLGVADHSIDAATELKTDFRNLGGFA